VIDGTGVARALGEEFGQERKRYEDRKMQAAADRVTPLLSTRGERFGFIVRGYLDLPMGPYQTEKDALDVAIRVETSANLSRAR